MTPPSPSLTATLADRYRVERELGQGGMATVYLAQDVRHDRRVALKVLRPELAAVIGASRFLAEIKTTANLQHPHILPLYDSGQVDGTVFYVMPFVEGESLRDRLNREKQLPIEDAVRIAREVAAALDYAHRQGVIHRDIKPENILLHDGAALVADFGIALAASKTGSGRMTETGMSLGTPHYMSPEQAMGERELDARSDVYALGCVTYEMLTGEPPFTGPTAQSIVAKVMTERPAPPSAARETVPEAVDDAVLAALSKLPADRPPTAAEFAAQLDGHAVRRSGRQTRVLPARVPARLQAFPWAVAVVAVLAAAMAWWRVAQEPTPRPVRFSIAVEPIGVSGNTLAVSADGRLIVHEGTAGGRRILYRRELGDLRAVPIAGTEGGSQPVLSPDDNEIAFATNDARVMRVPVEGGAPVPVTMVTTPIGMAWSRDHGLVLGMPSFHPTIRGLSLLATRGDTALRLLTHPDNGMHHDPVVLRDGKTVLYVDIPFRRAGTVVGTASLEDGTSVRSELPVAGGGIAGLVDGVLVFLGRDRNLMGVRFDQSSGQAVGRPIRISENLGRVEEAELAASGTLIIRVAPGPFQVVLLDAAGSTVHALPDTISFFRARYSPEGSQALLVAGGTSWLYDPAAGSRERLQTGGVDPREWTPDGRNLLGASSGVRASVSIPVDGNDTAQVLARTTNVQVNRAIMAPDGRTLVLGTGTGAGEFDLHTIRVGDTIATPLVTTPANEVAPRLSRDGRWLAYASDESGRFEVFVRSWPGPGPRIQVSDSGGGQPVWSGDGRRIFYRSGRAMRVAELAVSGTTLSVAGRRTLFEGEYYDTDHGALSPSYDVAPDGRRFLMAKALPGSRAEILVWMDWLPEFKQRLDSRTAESR